MEARGIDASGGKLSSTATGEVEVEDRVLILKRIRVVYWLEAPEANRETIERVHGMHARHCPVYRSLEGAIEITTEIEEGP
ncbi:MAG TPA: OsmC family protein [Gemmatimonadota bacterium]|nr:OsmC family protein [Gemmatimonadota bacterium]